ncbi:MAG: hypothetical protein HOV87_12125 [Catenulispora sp.]|nr:hypothetical protein [Catenulispora sp.]NUT40004.1 hypothetical protein [Thermoactinospora sp.]
MTSSLPGVFDRHESTFSEWLRLAISARALEDQAVPWPARSPSEALAVALILRRIDVLADLDCTENEAMERLARDIGATTDEVRAFFIGLRELV